MSYNAECTCGHVFDEHDDLGVRCEVVGCPCVQFEEDEDATTDGGDDDPGQYQNGPYHGTEF